MIFRNKLLVALSAFALVGGATAGLLASKANPVETKADETSKTFYLDCTGHDWDTYDSIALRLYSTPNECEMFYQATCAGDNYWYVTIDNIGDYTGAQFVKCNSVSGDHKSAVNLYHYQSWVEFGSHSDWFYYTVTSDSYVDNNCNWSAPTTNVTISGTHSDSTAINEAISTYKFGSSGLQTYTKTLALEAGDVITATNGTVTCDFDDLGTYNGQSANEKGYVQDDGHGAIKVVTAGTYELYVNVATGAGWMQIDSQSEIADFSTRFLAAMSIDAVCGSTDARHNEDNQTKVEAVWSTWKDEFENEITSGAKELFVTTNGDENVANAAKLYQHIVDRYGSSFLWSGAPSTVSIMASNPLLNNGNNTAVYVTAAAIGVTTIATIGGFLFLRKRKQF